MPRSTKTGTVTTTTYPGRIIITLAPPSAQQDGTVEFIVAKEHKMGGEQIGVGVERQPKSVTIADIAGVSVRLGNATYTGDEWIKVGIELFEVLHERFSAPTLPPGAPPAPPAAAKRGK